MLSLSLSVFFSLSRTHTRTHTHPHITHTRTHTHTHTPSQHNTGSLQECARQRRLLQYSCIHFLSPFSSLCLSLSLSLFLAHTHTHTHAHTYNTGGVWEFGRQGCLFAAACVCACSSHGTGRVWEYVYCKRVIECMGTLVYIHLCLFKSWDR